MFINYLRSPKLTEAFGDSNLYNIEKIYNYFVFLISIVSAQMSLAASGALYRGMDRAFCIRMKSTLTKRGCHFKSSGYRVSIEF